MGTEIAFFTPKLGRIVTWKNPYKNQKQIKQLNCYRMTSSGSVYTQASKVRGGMEVSVWGDDILTL